MPVSGDWRIQCREVLQSIWDHADSEPFREPVDLYEHPGKEDLGSFLLRNCNLRIVILQITFKLSNHQWIYKQFARNWQVEIMRRQWNSRKI